LKYINENEVPLQHRKGKDWDNLFKNIPKGKALVIATPSPMAVRRALYRRQKMGKFKHLTCIQRGKVTYILNSKGKEE